MLTAKKVRRARRVVPTAKKVGRARMLRGALVYKSMQQTIDRTSDGYVKFEAEDPSYNCAGIHDRTTNNSRLTVPQGTRRVRLTANLCLANAPDFYRSRDPQESLDVPRIAQPGYLHIARRENQSQPGFCTAGGDSRRLLRGEYFHQSARQCARHRGGLHLRDTWFAFELLD